jgi:hypothetical protein
MMAGGLARGRAASLAVVACAFLASLVACSARHAVSLPSSAAPVPRCSTPPRARILVQLGGDGTVLRGNNRPVAAVVPQGVIVAVSATFGERQLSYPSTDADALAALCVVRRAWTYTTYFRAQRRLGSGSFEHLRLWSLCPARLLGSHLGEPIAWPRRAIATRANGAASSVWTTSPPAVALILVRR